MAQKSYRLEIPNEKDVKKIKRILKAAGLIEVSPNHFVEIPKPVKKKTAVKSKPATKKTTKPKKKASAPSKKTEAKPKPTKKATK